jgi:segregation and condensation protein A
MIEKSAINKNINIDWKVDIASFEGPLDLLLHLIKKNNLDIYDIPISYITSEYLKYLKIIKILNLDNVGDFLVMASILMSIKSKMLLPKPAVEIEGEEDAEKMKQDLIERLIEYKKYKESSQILKEREKLFEGVQPLNQYPVKEFGQAVDATLFDLIDAFQKLIEKSQKNIRDIITEEFTIEDKMRFIMAKVERKSSFILNDLVNENVSVLELVVTLLAMLELVRTHQIKVLQKCRFGEIFIEGSNGEE